MIYEMIWDNLMLEIKITQQIIYPQIHIGKRSEERRVGKEC